MSEERESEVEEKANVLRSPLIVQDSDFERLVESEPGQTVICIPLKTPRGTRRGVFVFVEGATRKVILRSGKTYKVMVEVRGKATVRDRTSRQTTVAVSIEGALADPGP